MPGHRPLHPDASWTELIATDADWDAADPELLSAMFHQLVMIRTFEEYVLELAAAGLVHGPAHSSIGQEGGAVGSVLALQAGDEVNGSIDLLYIDGAHRFVPARADIRSWGGRVADGGVMLIHDSFSSIGVTGAIATELLASGRFEYVGRVGSLAEYRCRHPKGGARLRSAARQLVQLPWFVRNVVVKVLMLVHLHPLTRLFGHRSKEAQPY